MDAAREVPDRQQHYVYEKAVKLSDKPAQVLVLARDPNYLTSERSFVEHLGFVVIAAQDLCHSKAGHSLHIARGAQHSSFSATRFHGDGWLEGLNRLMSVKQPVAGYNQSFTECRDYNEAVRKAGLQGP